MHSQTTLIGNLTRAPEVNGAVTVLTVATDIMWTNAEGEKVCRTEFHRVPTFMSTPISFWTETPTRIGHFRQSVPASFRAVSRSPGTSPSSRCCLSL